MYIDFGIAKTIDGFKFAYIFPNCTQGACSAYPGPIAHTCKGNLYYKNQNSQWISAYTCPNLNAYNSSMVCPMEDSVSFSFAGISAQEWKFEMAGNYWLGAQYQTTTYYRVKDLRFRQYSVSSPNQATNINFTNINTNQFTLNWADGNGSNRAVFIKQDSVGTATPINNTTYTANTAFGSGSQIGSSGWYCVYNGSMHAAGVTVTNLLPNKSYRVMVCEYNGTTGTELYNITAASNNPKTQISCNLWGLAKTIVSNRDLSDGFACTDDLFFIQKAANDSMLVYDINTGNLIHTQKISLTWSTLPAFTVKNSRLYCGRTMFVLKSYNIADINNWVALDSVTGLAQGFLRFWPNDNSMIAWGKHWASQYQMIDISSTPMVLKCNVGTGGNNYLGTRFGDYIYVANAYTQNTRINISNPTNCVVSNFGGTKSVELYSSNTGLIVNREGYSNPVKTTIYNQSNSKTGEIIAKNNDFRYVLPDNFCLTYNPAANNMQLYDISDGTFNNMVKILCSKNGNFTHNSNYLIRVINDTIEFYQRNCTLPPVQSTNITFSSVQANQLTFNWNDGNGTNRAVFIKQDSVGNALPINNSTYSANSIFGSGTQIGTSGWYCVFNGTTHSSGVSVTNLLAHTKYRVMVCEYTGNTGTEKYNISNSTENPANQKTCLPVPVSLSISASNNNICEGASVTFTATPTNGGSEPVFQWKVNGNNVGMNSTAYSYNPANNDLVTCVLTSNALCTVANPDTSNTVTMIVNPVPPASISVAASANPVCAGTSVTFTANPTNGGATPTYQWKLNGANVGSNSPDYSYAPANNDVVTCVLSSNATCATGSPATSNAVSMTVNPNLPASISVAASANPVCAGNSVTFTATPTNGGTTPAYQWKVNGANVGSNSATYSNSSLANENIVTCVLTSNATCTTGSPTTSNAVAMTINPNLKSIHR